MMKQTRWNQILCLDTYQEQVEAEQMKQKRQRSRLRTRLRTVSYSR